MGRSVLKFCCEALRKNKSGWGVILSKTYVPPTWCFRFFALDIIYIKDVRNDWLKRFGYIPVAPKSKLNKHKPLKWCLGRHVNPLYERRTKLMLPEVTCFVN